MKCLGNWRKWRLAVKFDPDRQLPEKAFLALKHKNIDAVIIGGTEGINFDNTWQLAESVRQSGYTGVMLQEISSMDAVVPNVDGYLIPMVLNAGDKKWLIENQIDAIKKYDGIINWKNIIAEGYLVCNQQSAVGRLTDSSKITKEDAVAYTHLAEELLGLPVLYIEYSGVYGDIDLIRQVSQTRKKTQLFYGGGIKSIAQLNEVALYVDTVILGNVFYENPDSALLIVESFKRQD